VQQMINTDYHVFKKINFFIFFYNFNLLMLKINLKK
jgi:hypothetical protein